MSKLFDVESCDSESELKVNSNYANTYDGWRQKEELNKLKTKYGENAGDEDSSSSEEDETGFELTEQVEKEFYKTLACLKNKDPRIYDEKMTFFNKIDGGENRESRNKSKKERDVLLLRDYERKLIMERGGKFSDSEDEESVGRWKDKTRELTYVEEQRQLKESFKKVLLEEVAEEEERDDENVVGSLLLPKRRTKDERWKEEKDYKEWLKGQQIEIDDQEQRELKPLRDFWIDPNLDESEKFLRDYVLSKKFLDEGSANVNLDYDQIAHDSDENLSEDERNIERQEVFEHKYNFRFEEPDREFIKRYPRTMEGSLRRKDARRAVKRADVKKRKEEEKIRKREELKQLKSLKRKEIEEKLRKLEEITGSDNVRFSQVDLDGDFDPVEHDRRMQEFFNEDFYANPNDDAKPEFPAIDDELGIESTWDDYDPNTEELATDNERAYHETPHCEDPDFNMDADYIDAEDSKAKLVAAAESSARKNRRRRSKFAEVIAKKKPKFDPSVYSSYQEYFDQYYALNYEDMIGDLPCRFKYRNVVPNDYGLSIEEILTADDKELNKWCSLKKALRHKPEHVELNDVRTYREKSRNEALKRKILKSVYGFEENVESVEETVVASVDSQDDKLVKKRRRKNRKKKAGDDASQDVGKGKEGFQQKREEADEVRSRGEEKVGNARDESTVSSDEGSRASLKEGIERRYEEREGNDGPAAKKVKYDDFACRKDRKRAMCEKERKIRRSKLSNGENGEVGRKGSGNANADSAIVRKEKNVDRRRILCPVKHIASSKDNEVKQRSEKMQRGQKAITGKHSNEALSLSAERLKAYGINAKKLKNKLKYGKKK